MKWEDQVFYICKSCGWRGLVTDKFPSKEALQERHDKDHVCSDELKLVTDHQSDHKNEGTF